MDAGADLLTEEEEDAAAAEERLLPRGILRSIVTRGGITPWKQKHTLHYTPEGRRHLLKAIGFPLSTATTPGHCLVVSSTSRPRATHTTNIKCQGASSESSEHHHDHTGGIPPPLTLIGGL